MSIFPKRVRAKKAKTSGEHEAVQTFRSKLQSIMDGALEETKSLDEQLSEYIASESTPPPPHK